MNKTSHFSSPRREKEKKKSLLLLFLLPLNLIYQHAIQAYDDYKEALRYHDHPSPHVASTCIAWISPPNSMLKVNWDVTTNRGCTRIGIGVIIRDSCGNVLVSLQQPLFYCVNSLSALTKGLFMTASFCTQFGLTFVQFEGVSSHVVNTIIEKESCPW